MSSLAKRLYIRFTRAECNCSRLGNYGIHIEFSFRMTHRLLIKLPKIWTGATKEVLADHLLLISCKFWREIALAALKTVMVLVFFLSFFAQIVLLEKPFLTVCSLYGVTHYNSFG